MRELAVRLKLVEALDRPIVWRVAGCTLTVAFRRDERGLYVLRVLEGWPTRPVRRALALAEAFASHTIGEVREFQGPELARFKVLMLVTLGFEEPAPCPLPRLPDGAPAAAVDTWHAIARLLAIRRLTEPAGTPFALSAPWCSKVSGFHVNVIRGGKRWLEASGFLNRAGTAPSRYGKPTQLWTVSGELIEPVIQDPQRSVVTPRDTATGRRTS